MSLPTAHKAAAVDLKNEKGVVIKDKPLPVLGDDDILIKVRAVTLNPADYKQIWDWGVLKDGQSTGCDFAGDVAKLSPGAEGKGLKVGDPVAGFVRGGFAEDDNGAFQEYVKKPVENVWKVPTDVVSYEEAAAMGGISLSTVVHGLYHRMKLPPPWAPAKEPIPILIWAGATSVGIYAIKLAKLSGLRVATTASPQNHAMLKELGAEACFDYRDPDAPKKIKEWSQGKIKHGIDTISDGKSTALAAQAYSNDGGQICTMFPTDSGNSRVEVLDLFIFHATEKDKVEYFQQMNEWYKKLPEFASQLKTVMPLYQRKGGLDALPDAIAELRSGKIRAGKISVLF
ncbi:hypothetical protein M407DRAFT_242637 [Tulasnella calospora MUT 4182]|uniref:Enoyl reductase (ER) domain-containing protein n=1 Tax=Tulasnella calospora MUT 4182 TaxID=1051891 RepID=A0A0C3M6Z3_9AGAM|nr:hypothetical protein M407DRAFT_242637 [Tulasnella calospora MUT 4182]